MLVGGSAARREREKLLVARISVAKVRHYGAGIGGGCLKFSVMNAARGIPVL